MAASTAPGESRPLLYGELVPWYRLLDPADDHLDEAVSYQQAIERAVSPRPETLLELGAGAGHNALHLKRRFQCTLTDRSEPMLALSRDLNPECQHLAGDMRTLRLDRTFDAVLVHDAVMYMTTERDLRAAADTAFAHTRPGGAAIVAPDCTRETFREKVALNGATTAPLSSPPPPPPGWTWIPTRRETYVVEYDPPADAAACGRHDPTSKDCSRSNWFASSTTTISVETCADPATGIRQRYSGAGGRDLPALVRSRMLTRLSERQ